MTTVVRWETLDCENNEEGKCKLEGITLDDFFECEQVNQLP